MEGMAGFESEQQDGVRDVKCWAPSTQLKPPDSPWWPHDVHAIHTFGIPSVEGNFVIAFPPPIYNYTRDYRLASMWSGYTSTSNLPGKLLVQPDPC